MATTGTVALVKGEYILFEQADVLAIDGDVAIETDDITKYRVFNLTITAGAARVLVSQDGTNYTVGGLSLSDLGATSSTPVTNAANVDRQYGFAGAYKSIKVVQHGATPLEGAKLSGGVVNR